MRLSYWAAIEKTLPHKPKSRPVKVTEMKRYVFASVPYANAAPLTHFLPRVHANVRVTCAPPSELTAVLRRDQADAALVPVADYLATDNLTMLAPLGICANGEVRSVLLQCRLAIGQVRVVATDPASRTSNALARILLEEHVGQSVRMVLPVADAPADATVIIGDRALCMPPAAENHDLAALWKTMTSLPFVFAVWACRAGHPEAEAMAQILCEARALGGEAVDELAAIHAARLGLPVANCREYLGSIIHYDVGPDELRAMDLFKDLLPRRRGSARPAGSRQPAGAPKDAAE